MKEKILIVEDQFIEANHLRIMLRHAGYSVCGIAKSVQQAEEIISNERPGLVLLDIFLSGKRTGIELASQLREANIPFIYLSANSNEDILNAAKATHPNGFLVKPFREKDLLVAIEIARYHHEHGLESKLRKEVLFQKQLSLPTQEITDWRQKMLWLAKTIQPLVPFDYMIAGSTEARSFVLEKTVHFLRTGFDEYQVLDSAGVRVIANVSSKQLESLYTQTVLDPKIGFSSEDELPDRSPYRQNLPGFVKEKFGMNSQLTLPLPATSQMDGTFYFLFFSRRADLYTDEHLSLCQRLQYVISRAIAVPVMPGPPDQTNAHLYLSTETAKPRNEQHPFDGIIGHSHLLLSVFDLINQVAPADTSVLITGESGTGKESVADALHALSQRKSKQIIKVNCGALPANLIESELFGHEKGAFTGAFERRIGRFEQAHGGTIFLDEIGEMPLEAQVKLLRVLQQKEIERMGGKAPIKVDIRIIAATNRNLEKEVAEGRFRLDLYYRLNVFPIHLPALAERKEDIPLLVNHFINYYARKTGRKCNGISPKALANLVDYHWPGNIRELENLIERSILLSKGPQLEIVVLPVNNTRNKDPEREDDRLKTIFENERDHIISVLKKCNGRIRGTDGAAAILNVPPTTLGSKMKKLGIKRDYVI